jgi:hypothetical protein
MESMDFSGAGSLVQNIQKPVEDIKPEKNIEKPQMMEFSSSIADIMPPMQEAAYVNPSNQRVSGLSMPSEPSPPPSSQKSKNPFNLTDDQLNAIVAGLVAVLVFSSSVQSKLANSVPNFSGINGSISSLLVVAVIFYFVQRFLKNR